MRAAIYARVSTRKGQESFRGKKRSADLDKERGQNPEIQTNELRRYAQRNEFEVVKEYVERASAAEGKERPVFEQLLKDARNGEFDVILVWKIDRAFRSMQEFVYTTVELSKLGVGIVATTQGIDTARKDPMSKLTMNLLVTMAEIEHDTISERVKAGIDRRREKGLPVGRQRVDKFNEQIVKLHLHGRSARQIAEELGMKKSTVHERLKEWKRRQ